MNDTASGSIRAEIAASLPRLRRFARALARDAHDADDLVQLSVERALRHLDQWRPGTSVLSWLFGIVRNAWIDERRSRERRGRLFAPEDEGERMGDDGIHRSVELLAIQAALDRLSDDQRLAVSLVLVEGLSYQEAAEVMQVPVGTLTSRLARGRQALASMLLETAAPGAGPGDRR
jgi:RNA polymerase sigma-70 factor (ECF subfamily)